MSDIRWQGLSHQELYDQVWSGPGPQLSDPAQQIWREAGQDITEINNDLVNKLNGLVFTFDGEAASATVRSLRPLEDWQEQARQGANRTANGLQYQADGVAKVRNSMPPPEPSGWPEYPSWLGDPTGPFGIDPFFLEDWYTADARQSEASAQAVLVMETYEQSSDLNRDLIRPVETPPTVTTDFGGSVARASGNPAAFIAVPGVTAGAVAGFAAAPVAALPIGGEAIAAPPPSTPAAPGPTAPGAGGLVPVPPGTVGGAPGVGAGGTRPGFPGQIPPGAGGGLGIPPRPTGGFPGLIEPAGSIRPPGQVPGSIGAGSIGPGIGPGGIGGGGIGPGGIGGGGIGPGGVGSPGTGGGLGPAGAPGGGPGPGGGAGTGAGGLSPSGTSPAGTAANGRPAGSPGFFPGAGAGAGGGAREHRRPSYLVDDTDAFGDHRWITSGVLTPDDRPTRRRTTDYYDY